MSEENVVRLCAPDAGRDQDQQPVPCPYECRELCSREIRQYNQVLVPKGLPLPLPVYGKKARCCICFDRARSGAGSAGPAGNGDLQHTGYACTGSEAVSDESSLSGCVHTMNSRMRSACF